MSLILWSGGCDSTWLLYDLIRGVKAEDRQISSPGDKSADKPGENAADQKQAGTVRALSIIHPQVAARDEQRAARASFTRAMARRKLGFQHAEYLIEQYGHFSSFPSFGGGLTQPMIWLPTAYMYLHNEEGLYLGYVKGDDFWHWKADVIHMFNMFNNITGKNCTLHFPLEWTFKAEIIQSLQREKLYHHTWHCESPKAVGKGTKKCGTCHPCMVHKTALWQIETGNETGIIAKKDIDKLSGKEIKCEKPEKVGKGRPKKPTGPDFIHHTIYSQPYYGPQIPTEETKK